MKTPKELFVIVLDNQDYPVGIKRCPVISYDHKDYSGKIQVNDIYSADEADVETSEGTKHVTLGKDASDELEIALRLALHALELKLIFLHLDAIGAYQSMVLADTAEKRTDTDARVMNMYARLQNEYENTKQCAAALFTDVCTLQREIRESEAH